MKTPKPSTQSNLLESDTAVSQYLDDLLQEATEPAPEPPPARLKSCPMAVAENLQPAVLEPPTVLELWPNELPIAPAPAAPEVLDVSEAPPALDESLPAEADPETVSQSADADYQFPLQCLLFEVQGVPLALPLIELESVIPLPEQLSQLPGYAKQILGVMQNRDRNVSVIDSAELLRVPRQLASEPAHVLVLHGASFGLSCDKLGSVVHLKKEDVQWSKALEQHAKTPPLMLGKIRDRLTALLNPAGLRARFPAPKRR